MHARSARRQLQPQITQISQIKDNSKRMSRLKQRPELLSEGSRSVVSKRIQSVVFKRSQSVVSKSSPSVVFKRSLSVAVLNLRNLRNLRIPFLSFYPTDWRPRRPLRTILIGTGCAKK
jgi:hypothetical protein